MVEGTGGRFLDEIKNTITCSIHMVCRYIFVSLYIYDIYYIILNILRPSHRMARTYERSAFIFGRLRSATAILHVFA